VLLPHDWMTFRLTGRLVTDRGDASGTGYWSPRRDEYSAELLDLVDSEHDWEAAVPIVLGPTEAAGEWAGAIVGPGTGDNMAGALGVGLRAGDVAISIGTSGTVYSVSEQPTEDPSGYVAGFADATGRYLPLVCTLNAAKVTDTAARLLGVGLEELDALALSAEPGAGGLTLLPYLDGERTPDRPEATGVLGGLRSDVGREQLARAAFEGVVCGLLDGLDALTAFAPADGRLLLGGGGARSRAYRQVLADLSGRQVVMPHAEEQVATGACVQAAAVVSGADPHEIADRWGLGAGDVVDPGPGASAAADVRAAYAHLRDTTPWGGA
jgi:xylulokinase